MNCRKWVLTALLLVALAVALAGPLSRPTTQAQAATSRLRFLHAVPGAPSLDVYLDGGLVASGLSAGEATPHLTIAGGEHQVALRQAGAAASASALLEINFPLDSELAYTLLAQGTPDALQAAVYEDILDEFADVGLARLKAINAVPDSPALDLVNRETSGPLLQGVGYGQSFGTVNIGVGTQDLVMVPAGGAVASAVAQIGEIALQSGTLYTIVAMGSIDANTVQTLVLATPTNGTADSARVQVAHGSPDAPAVDVYLDSLLIAPALELGQMTNHIALPAGPHTLALRPAGAPAADAPLVSTDVTLAADSSPVTIVAVGQVSDGSLALQSFSNDVSDLAFDQARIAVYNAVPGATVSATASDPSATLLASALAADGQGTPVDVAPGEYRLTVNIQGIDNPVDLVVPEEVYNGGMFYSVLVYGGGANNALYDARVTGTAINVGIGSLPVSAPPVVVAEVPTATSEPVTEPLPLATEAPVVADTPAPTQDTGSEVVPDAGGQGESELVAQPTTPPQPTVPPQPVAPPQQQQPIAYVELDPGANLHCRELPASDKRSMGLIPSGSTLTVVGRTGTALLPETGNPTPEPTPVAESIEQLWLSVEWSPPGGGYVRCWVNAQYLRVEFQGKLLDTLEELWELPEEPFNRPGEVVGATVLPPTPLFDAVLATVQLEPGVSLQLRRNPKTDAESLALVPAQAQLEVLGYAVVPSEGLVGQPTDPNWLYVRYRTENGGATIGWVSAQYVTLSKLGHTVAITDLVVIDVAEAGYFELPGQAPVIPAEQQKVVGVVNLNPGANLNLRDRPTADARVVVGIPSGDSMIVNGRNGDGSWVQVTYTSAAGDLDGWVATQYLIITRGGLPYAIKDLPILTGEADTMTTP
jgi:hypothetical protein